MCNSVRKCFFCQIRYSTLVSSAALELLYFNTLTVINPPGIATPEAFKLVDLVDQRKPEWGGRMHAILGAWDEMIGGMLELREILNPVHDRMTFALTAYPADRTAMGRSEELLERAERAGVEIGRTTSFPVACGELVRHVFLKLYLEEDEDIDRLYRASAEVFRSEGLERRLLQAALLRLTSFERPPGDLLLNNPGLLPLLEALEPEAALPEGVTEPDELDLIAWEIFRRIVGPRTDPLTAPSVEKVEEIHANNEGDLNALKQQCQRLAEQAGTLDEQTLRRFLRLHVADDLAAVLEFDKRAKEEYLAGLASDPKVITGILVAAAGSATTGEPVVSVVGALAAVGTALAKGVEVGYKRHRELQANPYRIVRRLGRDAEPQG